jgi:dynein heavy chain
MNTVLTQEIIRYVKNCFLLLFIFNYVIRYNKLLNTIHTSLQELLKAMKGLVVLSQGLEEMSKSLFNNAVPVMWSKAVCFYFY